MCPTSGTRRVKSRLHDQSFFVKNLVSFLWKIGSKKTLSKLSGPFIRSKFGQRLFRSTSQIWISQSPFSNSFTFAYKDLDSKDALIGQFQSKYVKVFRKKRMAFLFR